MGMPTAESASAIRGSDPACAACYWVSGHIWDKLMLHFGLIVTTVVPQSKLSDRRSNSEKSPRRWRPRQTLRLRGWKRDQIMANILSRFPEELPPYLHWIDSACNANRSGQISISVTCCACESEMRWNKIMGEIYGMALTQRISQYITTTQRSSYTYEVVRCKHFLGKMVIDLQSIILKQHIHHSSGLLPYMRYLCPNFMDLTR